MGDVGYSDSDSEINFTAANRRVRFNQKNLNNKIGSTESPRFGFTRGHSQDSFTTQCSTPRLNDKYSQLFNYNNQTYRSVGVYEPELGDFTDPFDKIMSQTLHLEQLSNLPDVYISDKQQWDGFINTLPPTPNITPKQNSNLNIELKPQTDQTETNVAPLNAEEYPLITSAINRNWDSLLNFAQKGDSTLKANKDRQLTRDKATNERRTNGFVGELDVNQFQWWSDDQQIELQSDDGARLAKLSPQGYVNTSEMGMNTDMTSLDVEDGGNRLRVVTKLNEQYQDRIQQIIDKNGDLNVDINGLQDDAKEFIVAVRDHLVRVHHQMEVLVSENMKLRAKIARSSAMLGPLCDTLAVFRQDASELIVENANLVKELKAARQDKAYAIEYCKTSNEALRQTNMQKDKILADFNNIANSKVLLEKEFKETIDNMQSMKTKLIEWQSKVNGVTPAKKTVRFSDESNVHFVSQTQPPTMPLQSTTPVICKSVQEQLQSYQLNCNNYI